MQTRLREILLMESRPERQAQLGRLRQEQPEAMLAALVQLLEDPLEDVRRRAGSALGLFSRLNPGPVTVERHVEELARILQEGGDPRVRLSCAILLMPIRHPAADRAYRQALHDSHEKVVQLACLEMSVRADAEGVRELRSLLKSPSWPVRLEACKALITLKVADQQVVNALESLKTEPQAAVHDAETAAVKDDLLEMLKILVQDEVQDEPGKELWGTMDEILVKARSQVKDRG